MKISLLTFNTNLIKKKPLVQGTLKISKLHLTNFKFEKRRETREERVSRFSKLSETLKNSVDNSFSGKINTAFNVKPKRDTISRKTKLYSGMLQQRAASLVDNESRLLRTCPKKSSKAIQVIEFENNDISAQFNRSRNLNSLESDNDFYETEYVSDTEETLTNDSSLSSARHLMLPKIKVAITHKSGGVI